MGRAPSEAGEQREVRPSVEGQASKAPSSPPPHEGAAFLMQPAMLRGRDLEGRALDNRPQHFAGEPTDLDARRSASASNSDQSARSPAAASKSPAGSAARRGGCRPQTRRPSRCPSFVGPGHSDNRMTLAIYTRPTKGMQDSATAALKRTFLDPALDTRIRTSARLARPLGYSRSPLSFGSVSGCNHKVTQTGYKHLIKKMQFTLY